MQNNSITVCKATEYYRKLGIFVPDLDSGQAGPAAQQRIYGLAIALPKERAERHAQSLV